MRGTVWSVANQCNGTLTRAMVIVRDFRRHGNVRLSAGHSYLAKAPAA